MPTVPLPAAPSLEQLKKQAKDLQRAVRSADADAVALVAEHHPDGSSASVAASGFSLDSAQLVLARRYGFTSWPGLKHHVQTITRAARSRRESTFEYTPDDWYHARRNWTSEHDTERCRRAASSAHPDPTRWQPLLTVHSRGVTVIVFRSPAGPLFAELTPTTITLSRPTPARPTPGQATLLFHTTLGTMAGVTSPEIHSLSLERPTDRLAYGDALVTDGIFVIPNAFTVTTAGLVLRPNQNRTSDIVPVDALPQQAKGIVDRPRPPVDRTSPAGQRLSAAIAKADCPPTVDPDHWEPGAYLKLTSTEQVQLGRYGNLLASCRFGGIADRELYVHDLDPPRNLPPTSSIIGTTISATRMFYNFQDGHSSTIAILGLINDDHVASITLTSPGKLDITAVIANRTFILAGPTFTSPDYETTRITTRDMSGTALEEHYLTTIF
jgi:hypothetical protein